MRDTDHLSLLTETNHDVLKYIINMLPLKDQLNMRLLNKCIKVVVEEELIHQIKKYSYQYQCKAVFVSYRGIYIFTQNHKLFFIGNVNLLDATSHNLRIYPVNLIEWTPVILNESIALKNVFIENNSGFYFKAKNNNLYSSFDSTYHLSLDHLRHISDKNLNESLYPSKSPFIEIIITPCKDEFLSSNSGRLLSSSDNLYLTNNYTLTSCNSVSEATYPVDTIASICSETDYTLVLTQSGKIYFINHCNSYINADSIASPIENPSHAFFVQIVMGECHSMALTKSGNVYSWGRSNFYGQLGLEDRVTPKRPSLIKALEKESIIKIGASAFSSFALSKSGKLFIWGQWQSHPSLQIPSLPKQVQSPDLLSIKEVSLNDSRLVIFTETNKLYEVKNLSAPNDPGNDQLNITLTEIALPKHPLSKVQHMLSYGIFSLGKKIDEDDHCPSQSPDTKTSC